jgi:citrate lyase subunit beta/citryl-CoA lyase
MQTRDLPHWRSLLFCPANSDRFVRKAHTRGADAIILDLEDAVPTAEKEAARAGLSDAVRSVGQDGADVCVRINRRLDWAVQDIATTVQPGVFALVVPKVMGGEHLRLLGEIVAAREAEVGLPIGHTRFVALVETAAAIAKLGEIASATPRLVALAVGGEDLATDLDAEPTADSLYVAKMLGLHAARAAAILPLGVLASVAGIEGNDAYVAMLRRSRSLGFACATCVHPSHVPLLNEAFAPSAASIERAGRLLAAFDSASARGQGAVEFEGSMVDEPVAKRARRLLERAQRRSAT